MKKLIIVLLAFASFGLASSAFAIDILPTCAGTDSTGQCIPGVCSTAPDSPACVQAKAQAASGSNPIAGPHGIIQKATNLLAELTGVVGIIMLVVAGFIYTTAGGALGGQGGDNPNKAKKARTMILVTLSGMIVVALAWSIVTFVVQRFIK